MVVVTSVRAARAPAALRVVAPAAPLRLPRRRARAAAPALDRAGVPQLARPRTVFWWGLWIAAAGAVLVWRVGAAAVAQPAPPAARHRGRAARPTACVSVLHDRPPPGPAAAPRPASSSPGASSPARLDPRAPVLAVRGARRPEPADHRQGPRRRQRRAARHVRPGTRVLVEGPYGRLTARARTRTQGGAHRRGRRHHAAARAGRGAATTRRATPSCSTATRDRAAVRRRARRSWPASAGSRCSGCPGRRRAPDSWLGDRRRPAPTT